MQSFNEATLLPILLNIKITTTEALDGKKCFFFRGKLKVILKFEDN